MGSLALGYLITWRTYGTWLHGDGRRSTHHRLAHSYRSPDLTPTHRWRDDARDRMREPAFVLDDAGRAVVQATVSEVCDHPGWCLLAVNARTNHVHTVLSCRCAPEVTMTTLKAWSTRRLREAKRVADDARVWARHGSTRYLWTEEDVRGAVRYVVERRLTLAARWVDRV
jgi:REP element-mobilizing transposase RayT